MPEKTVAQKLLLKEGRKVLFVNPPPAYEKLLGDLPDNVTVLNKPSESPDVIQLFVDSRQELEEQLAELKAVLDPKGALWVTYHKGTSKVKTDINRDSIVEYARSLGMEGVAMISVNEDWSALRLKVIE